MKRWLLAMSLSMACLSTASVEGSEPDTLAVVASKVLTESGVKGGLVVHIGCGDGKLTAALRANAGYRKLNTFTYASIIQLATWRFCNIFLNKNNDPCGRQFDQMTQAARSGRANIVEGLCQRLGRSRRFFRSIGAFYFELSMPQNKG